MSPSVTADGRERVLALEARPLRWPSSETRNQCEGVIGASIGMERRSCPPPRWRCVRKPSIRTAGREHPLAHPRGSGPARAGDHASSTACRHRGPRGCGLGQGLPAVGAELRAGIVLPAAILASAQCHKVRWPNLLLAASLPTCDSSAPRSSSSQRGRREAAARLPPHPRHPIHLRYRASPFASRSSIPHREPIQAQDSSSCSQCRPGPRRGRVVGQRIPRASVCDRQLASRGWPLPSDSLARFQIVGARRCPFRAAGNHVRRPHRAAVPATAGRHGLD